MNAIWEFEPMPRTKEEEDAMLCTCSVFMVYILNLSGYIEC